MLAIHHLLVPRLCRSMHNLMPRILSQSPRTNLWPNTSAKLRRYDSFVFDFSTSQLKPTARLLHDLVTAPSPFHRPQWHPSQRQHSLSSAPGQSTPCHRRAHPPPPSPSQEQPLRPQHSKPVVVQQKSHQMRRLLRTHSAAAVAQ